MFTLYKPSNRVYIIYIIYRECSFFYITTCMNKYVRKIMKCYMITIRQQNNNKTIHSKTRLNFLYLLGNYTFCDRNHNAYSQVF